MDPHSVLSSILSHACHAAAEASLSILFVPVTSGSGWMKLSTREAYRLRWKVSFISHSWFYFSTRRRRSDREAGEEEHGREEDWYCRERHELPATWASCSQFMNEAFASVMHSGDLTRWMELIVCLCTRQSYCSAFTVRDFPLQKILRRKRNQWKTIPVLGAKDK